MGAVISVGAATASSVITGLVTALSWCFCTALMSLCGSCCGNDKPSSEAPSISSGRKRSALLMLISVGLALVFQYALAPHLSPDNTIVTSLPKVGPFLLQAWSAGCDKFDNDNVAEKCRGNAAVYRVSFATSVFFLLASCAAACKPTFNREVWPAKYVLFLFFVAGTIFIPNVPTLLPIYMQLARVGATFFILLEQVILIDMAYNWNESWVDKAEQDERDQGIGKGKKWLGAILVSAVLLFVGSLVGLGFIFHWFKGCAVNTAFASITLILIVLSTLLQLSGEEASLLTSATIAAYATYLCYMAVSRNPNGTCNPRLGDEDVMGIVIGIGLTLGSLAWTGYSITAEKNLGGGGEEDDEDAVGGFSSTLVGSHSSENKEDVKGVVLGTDDGGNYGTTLGTKTRNRGAASDKEAEHEAAVASWRLNIVLMMVSCWYAMVLTGWGGIAVDGENGGNAANPQVSTVSMWMLITAQWTCFLLYGWTMVAPRLFPDRDFS